jgi:hypothetical protein
MSKQLFEQVREQGDNPPAITEQQWISATGFSKEKNTIMAEKIVNDVLNGILNPLDVHIFTKSIENTIKMIQTALSVEVLDEAYKHGEKTFVYRGCECNIRELGVKYDFANCNDAVYNDLIAKMEVLKAEVKARETFLKAIKQPTEVNGVMINPPIKSSTTGVAVTIK